MACMSNNVMLEAPANTEKAEADVPPRSLMRQDSKSRWESGWMFPRRWMLPALATDFPTNMELFKTKDSEVIRVKEDGSKLVARSFSRKYSLPATAEADQVASNLSSDGVLVITAPKKALAIK